MKQLNENEPDNSCKSESGQQFDEIYKKHHDPEERKKRKIIENRKKRFETNKEDLGM